MAGAGELVIPGNVMDFTRTAGGRKIVLMLGVAAVVALMAAVWMWGRQPEYRVLFSNFSDRDGGEIVAQLEKMNIPYKYAEGGGALLVPADRVHDARLKLAAQGLPKGGNVGFELMENQKLGSSQFLEQVNFQRAMEGELARSIESLSAVQAARVHLAMPKDSVFVSEQKQPTASVLLNLHPGRVLDAQQVSAIVHLVASSVPELSPKNVTIVDQNGNLLSDTGRAASANGMDPSQIKYVQDYQQSVVKRIESIISPIVGADNVRAEATADMDFSRSEQAVESYKPNQAPDAMAIRSQQTSESTNASPNPGGVPGALTNQPPAPATAPITTPGPAAPGQKPAVAAAPPATPTATHKDATVNYEVDKTIQYVQKTGGGLRRLSVAVVVNYRTRVDKAGKVAMTPLTPAEIAQITNLVKEAMGYDKARGDTLNVVNSPFATATPQVIPEVPLWKQPQTLDMGLQAGKYLLMALALFVLYTKAARPLLKKLSNMPALPPAAQDVYVQHGANGETLALPGRRNYQENLSRAQKLASEDPRVVANIVKTWVGSNE